METDPRFQIGRRWYLFNTHREQTGKLPVILIIRGPGSEPDTFLCTLRCDKTWAKNSLCPDLTWKLAHPLLETILEAQGHKTRVSLTRTHIENTARVLPWSSNTWDQDFQVGFHTYITTPIYKAA